jgi:hypothetical protein
MQPLLKSEHVAAVPPMQPWYTSPQARQQSTNSIHAPSGHSVPSISAGNALSNVDWQSERHSVMGHGIVVLDVLVLVLVDVLVELDVSVLEVTLVDAPKVVDVNVDDVTRDVDVTSEVVTTRVLDATRLVVVTNVVDGIRLVDVTSVVVTPPARAATAPPSVQSANTE